MVPSPNILLLKTLRCCNPSHNFWCSLSFWCPGDCGPPPHLHFASPENELNETNYKSGTFLKYNCRPGYIKTSSKNVYLHCERSGEWTYNPFCVSKYDHLFFLLVPFTFLLNCLRSKAF